MTPDDEHTECEHGVSDDYECSACLGDDAYDALCDAGMDAGE